MKPRLQQLWDTLRSSYWFVPTLMTLASVLVWLCMTLIDRALQARYATPVAWLFTSDVATAQTLLLAVAGATIGVVGVVFSLTTVPLTIAATQLGPRLLRNFLRDLGTQLVLGLFVATFAYCMLVLLSLDQHQPLPQATVTLSLILAATDLGALIYYISHVAVEIQAPHVLAEVARDLLSVIDEVFPAPLTAHSTASAPQLPPPDALPVPALASGYIEAIDTGSLVTLACERNLVIHLHFRPGQFVTAGVALAYVWPAPVHVQQLAQPLTDALILGTQRTLVQDVEFGFNSLVEVGVRALSPAINDPFTAMTSIDWLGVALCRLCARAQPTSYHDDAQGTLRLVAEHIDFRQLTDAAFNLLREYGCSSATVSTHLLHVLATIAQCTRTTAQRAAIRHHAQLVEHDTLAICTDPYDRQRVTNACERVINILASAGS